MNKTVLMITSWLASNNLDKQVRHRKLLSNIIMTDDTLNENTVTTVMQCYLHEYLSESNG